MTEPRVTDEEVAELALLMAEGASAFIRGDIPTYAALMRHADDFTLMAPSGGEPRRGFDDSDENLDALAGYFRRGEAELEVFQTYRDRVSTWRSPALAGLLRSRPVSRILSRAIISLGGVPGSSAGRVSGACFTLHRTGFG